MGQKVNPIGLRLGINKGWDSVWYSKKNYSSMISEDLNIRNYIDKELKKAAIYRVGIERFAERMNVNIYSARPGLVIGKKGANVDKIKKDIQKLTGLTLQLNIIEVKNAESKASLIAQNIATQLEQRKHFRRVLKNAINTAVRADVKGIKVVISGRLGGAEMSRSEKEMYGRVPLHTLRADIDYGFAEAKTTVGQIGIKVWIYNGDILDKDQISDDDKYSVKRRMT